MPPFIKAMTQECDRMHAADRGLGQPDEGELHSGLSNENNWPR
jgi:hypothetical protein